MPHRLTRIASRVVAPAVRSTVAVASGAVLVVAGLAQWSAPLAAVVAGAALVAYGLLFVDLDAAQPRRRGRRG